MNLSIFFRRLLLAAFVFGTVTELAAQGTAFMYQGRLNDSGAPAGAAYDFRFALYDAATNGHQAGVSLTNSAVVVTSGLFAVTLDFGADVFTGTNYWLDLAVRAVGVTNFTALAPRQPVLAVPYAVFANSASNLLGTVAASQLTGTLPSAQVAGNYSGAVNFSNATNAFNGAFAGNGGALTNLSGSQIAFGTVADARLTTNVALLNRNQTFTGTNFFGGFNSFTNATNFFNGAFAGNGTALTNLNGTQITFGTVADARLTTNVALLNTNQTFSGVNTLTNWGNTFVGNFSGNGLVQWVPVSNTATQAVRDTGYLLLNPGLTTVTLPQSANMQVGDIVRISGAGAGGWLAAANSGQSILGNFASYRNGFLASSAYGGDWRGVCASADGTRMYAGGNFSGGVSYSTDAGRTWTATTITGNHWFAIACSKDGGNIYAAANGSYILKSSDGGLTWPIYSSSASWTSVACSADGSKVIAGATGSALALTTGNSPATANWTVVACSSDGTNLAAAAGSTVYTSTNAGYNWIYKTLPGSCSALAAAASGLKLVAAYNGGLATSTNFGASWNTISTPGTNWSCLAGSSDCTRLVAGVSNGLFYASANFGATWTPLTTTNQFWSGASLSADGSRIGATVRTAGGTPGDIFYSAISTLPVTTSTNGTICGSQGSAVELQFIGNNQFMPVSSAGLIWAN